MLLSETLTHPHPLPGHVKLPHPIYSQRLTRAGTAHRTRCRNHGAGGRVLPNVSRGSRQRWQRAVAGPLISPIWAVPNSIAQLDGPNTSAVNTRYLARDAAHLPCRQRREGGPGARPLLRLKRLMCLCICECTLHVPRCLWRPEDSGRTSRSGVIGVCEWPAVGAVS